MSAKTLITCIGSLLVVLLLLPVPLAAQESESDHAVAEVIARFRTEIPRLMEEQGVPGVAVALVDGDQVLWTEGFGHLDRDGDSAVTAETLFGVQSISKVFTATAVMIAVQEGLVDLDEPIVTYLPEFTVESVFEEHPETRITLRMLLSHTAGFTHEAPIGNNFELDQGTFQSHVQSISETWLRFPVGTGYAYSNLGIDLAGQILERVYRQPFPQLMREKVLDPIGMDRSTFDRDEILSSHDRATGHMAPYPDTPLDPMTAAGGLFASADDMARFLRFQLGNGTIDGLTLVDPALMTEMRTVPEPHSGAAVGYALGVDRTRWIAGRKTDLLLHGGGGFGFLTDLWWLPDLQLGVTVLTNSSDHTLQGSLAQSILTELIHQSPYAERLANLPSQDWPVDANASYALPPEIDSLVEEVGMKPVGDELERWAAYSGNYLLPMWGAIDPLGLSGRFFVEAGEAYFETVEQGTPQHLTEVALGRFLSENGETLDLSGPVPTWRNIELTKSSDGPTVWQWVLLGLAVAVAATWIVAAIIRAARHRRNRSEDEPRLRAGRIAAGGLALLTSIFGMAAVALIIAAPRLVDSGFIGWLDLPVLQRLALHLPLLLVVMLAALAGIVIVGWAGGWWTDTLRWQYLGLIVAAVILTSQLLSWSLIGWGWT